MYEETFADRLAHLRMIKNISAREMSLAIGQNRNYINQIENKKMFPTMPVFFAICEYLNITPRDFFDDGNTYPEQLAGLVADLKKLNAQSLAHISGIVKELIGRE